MNGFAMFAASEALRLANERAEVFRQERANDRLAAGAPRRSPFGTIASAVSSIRAALWTVDVDRTIPSLTDYPYRG